MNIFDRFRRTSSNSKFNIETKDLLELKVTPDDIYDDEDFINISNMSIEDTKKYLHSNNKDPDLLLLKLDGILSKKVTPISPEKKADPYEFFPYLIKATERKRLLDLLSAKKGGKAQPSNIFSWFPTFRLTLLSFCVSIFIVLIVYMSADRLYEKDWKNPWNKSPAIASIENEYSYSKSISFRIVDTVSTDGYTLHFSEDNNGLGVLSWNNDVVDYFTVISSSPKLKEAPPVQLAGTKVANAISVNPGHAGEQTNNGSDINSLPAKAVTPQDRNVVRYSTELQQVAPKPNEASPVQLAGTYINNHQSRIKPSITHTEVKYMDQQINKIVTHQYIKLKEYDRKASITMVGYKDDTQDLTMKTQLKTNNANQLDQAVTRSKHQLQLTSFAQEHMAQLISNRLIEMGFASFVKEDKVEGKSLYRVISEYKNLSEVNKWADISLEVFGQEPIPMTLSRRERRISNNSTSY